MHPASGQGSSRPTHDNQTTIDHPPAQPCQPSTRTTRRLQNLTLGGQGPEKPVVVRCSSVRDRGRLGANGQGGLGKRAGRGGGGGGTSSRSWRPWKRPPAEPGTRTAWTTPKERRGGGAAATAGSTGTLVSSPTPAAPSQTLLLQHGRQCGLGSTTWAWTGSTD